MRKRAEFPIKYCAICGKPIPTVLPCGKPVSSGRYATKKYCSNECMYKGKIKENKRSNDRLYILYYHIKSRCYNPKNISAKWYSEKGIGMCEEWLNDYETFKAWAIENGYDYSKSMKEQTIDRIDSNKDYSPDNCRFVTMRENAQNTSQNVNITYQGKTQCLSEWSRELGIPVKILYKRAKRHTDPEKIFCKDKLVPNNESSGITGIHYRNKTGLYVVQAHGKYVGCSKSLEKAKEIRNKYAKG